MVVPVFGTGGAAVGTIDVETAQPNAFTDQYRSLFDACAAALRPLREA